MAEDEDYIDFGDFSRRVLKQQCQYGSRYLSGIGGYPNLSEGLRVKGKVSDYHSLKIHKDDAVILKKRVDAWHRGRHHGNGH
jgi:hypothetical protein